MIYRLLADLVIIVHAALLVFFVIGGFLAWRWFKLIWGTIAIALWNLAIVVFDYGCPVTAAEKALRRRGGEPVYEGGFIGHYLDGRLWPEGATPTAEKVGFAILLISYIGLFVVRRRRRHRPSPA